MKILVADDTASDRVVLKSYLKQLGHDVVEATDGITAVKAYREHREELGLIILDVLMPNMDGHQAAREIHAVDVAQWIPIIFLSARTDSEDIAAGIEAGGDDYLTKPVDKIILTAKMQAMQRIAAMRQKLAETNLALENALESYRKAMIEGDLNNILHIGQVVKGDSGAPMNPEQTQYADFMLTAGQRILRLMDDVRKLAVAEAGEGQLKEEEINPRDIIAGALQELAPYAEERKTAVHNLVGGQEGLPTVYMEVDNLKLSLLSMMSAAVEHSGVGGTVTIDALIDNAGRLQFMIADDGPAMTETEIDDLFDPILNAGRIDIGGAGVGLAMAQRAVRLIGAKLTINAGSDKGNVYALRLPVSSGS
jgi:DNA-binding response OmpR family regulator